MEDGTKSAAVDVACDLYSGSIIDGGSGRAEGTETSVSGVEVAGDLCNGTTIEEGSDVAEGTKSLVPADVDVAGLETGRFGEVTWRSASFCFSSFSSLPPSPKNFCLLRRRLSIIRGAVKWTLRGQVRIPNRPLLAHPPVGVPSSCP